MEKLIQLLNSNYDFCLDNLPSNTLLSDLQKLNPSFDSLTVIQFIIDAEDTFNFQLPEGVNPKTFDDILKYMESSK